MPHDMSKVGRFVCYTAGLLRHPDTYTRCRCDTRQISKSVSDLHKCEGSGSLIRTVKTGWARMFAETYGNCNIKSVLPLPSTTVHPSTHHPDRIYRKWLAKQYQGVRMGLNQWSQWFLHREWCCTVHLTWNATDIAAVVTQPNTSTGAAHVIRLVNVSWPVSKVLGELRCLLKIAAQSLRNCIFSLRSRREKLNELAKYDEHSFKE